MKTPLMFGTPWWSISPTTPKIDGGAVIFMDKGLKEVSREAILKKAPLLERQIEKSIRTIEKDRKRNTHTNSTLMGFAELYEAKTSLVRVREIRKLAQIPGVRLLLTPNDAGIFKSKDRV